MAPKPTLPRPLPKPETGSGLASPPSSIVRTKSAGALAQGASASIGASSQAITQEAVVAYLVRATLAERWAILCRVAIASNPQAPSASEPPSTPSYVCPPPGSVRKPLELVDVTDAAVPEPRAGSMTDVLERLFSTMHALNALETTSEGARFCLNAAMQAVPCLVALVHLKHQPTGDLVVVHTQGPGAESLVGTRTAPTDALVVRAFRSARAAVVMYGADKPGSHAEVVCARHKAFDPWSVAFVPVLSDGQLLGLIEMIDPTDGAPFTEARQSALAYIADKLGSFVASHGLDSVPGVRAAIRSP